MPAGQSATVAGRQVGGMIYVGSGLRPVSSYRGDVEPALLPPHHKVSWTQPDHDGRLMHYWPSYSSIDPASRAAYLLWLSSGRKDPAAYIGYVFLFFYGFERRVLIDAQTSDQAKAEISGLLSEVERLLEIYGGNRSFHGYASSFLAIARLLHHPIDPATLLPPKIRNTWEIPLTLKIALGAFAAEGKSVPVEWAYAWAACSPEIRLRTAAQRCPEEFEELFKIRYAEAFPGEGFKIRPNKTFIKAEYRPASPSFSGSVSLTLNTLPDVAGLTGPLRKLQEIVDRAVQDLDVYSRWVGRTGDGLSPAALSLLPPELARGRQSEEGKQFVTWIEERLAGGDVTVVEAADLAERWPCQTPSKLVRRDAEMLALFLAQQGYGLEPDVRFGGPPVGSGKAVVFRLVDGAGPELGAAYHAAAVLLQLAVAISAADGEISASEERHLLAYLERALHLSAASRTRLKAHLRWLMAAPPGLNGLKKKIEPLAEPQRREIGQFLVTVAGADGHVSAEELKLLTRIYPLLGLEAQSVYSDVHALASAEAPSAAEPVTVRPAGPGAASFPIPTAPRPDGILLDPGKIRAKLAESEDVAGLLEGIFAAEEEPVRRAQPKPAAPEGPSPVAGLDAIHSTLLRRLAAKAVWEWLEVERLAAEFGLLPDGALEVINEAAFERCGAPLLEGDETLEVDGQVLEEILA
ncbi:MAG TPA: TerB N-terminal domain-containing protein [Thermoanaerobaculia bacterium]|nr:TerB N-terminal domain-containing protein [Thermoanaerobaculia bacterium]